MAKVVKNKTTLGKTANIKKGTAFSMPFEKINYIIFGLGLLVILAGYILLSVKPWNSTASLVFGPILLILGYVGFFIFGIFAKKEWFQKKSEVNQNDFK